MSRRPLSETTTNTPPPKKQKNIHYEILIELLADQSTCAELVQKEKLSHVNSAEYDLFRLSYKDENGLLVKTRYAFCDHVECRHDTKGAVYYAVRKESCLTNPKVEATCVSRHEKKHVNAIKTVNFLAVSAIVKHQLPIGHFELEGIRELLGFLDKRFSQGVPSSQIKKNLSVIAAESFQRTKILAHELLETCQGSFLADHYENRGRKFLAILLVHHSTIGDSKKWVLYFRKAENCTDEATRQIFYEVLTKYELQRFYDQKVYLKKIKQNLQMKIKRLMICGDSPIKRAFQAQISSWCMAHIMSLIAKNFINKCKAANFAERYKSTVAAVSAFNYKTKRANCEKRCLNDALLCHVPQSQAEINWIKNVRGKNKPLRLLSLQTVNFIRFRSVFEVFKRLHIAKIFIQNSSETYYDNNCVDWDLVNFMFLVGKPMTRYIDRADSDRICVADSLFLLFKLMDSILALEVPGDYKCLQRELVLSCADYLFGNRKTQRYQGHGPAIEARADSLAILGLFLELSGRDFEFSTTRDAVADALKNGILTKEDDILLRDLLNEAVTEWKDIARRAAHDILQRIATPVTENPASPPSETLSSAPTSSQTASSEIASSATSSSQGASTQSASSQQSQSLSSACSSMISSQSQLPEKNATDESQTLDHEDDSSEDEAEEMRKHYNRILGSRTQTQAGRQPEPDLDSEIERWVNMDVDDYDKWFSTLPEEVKYSPLPGQKTELYFKDSTSFPLLGKVARVCCSTPGSASRIERLFSRLFIYKAAYFIRKLSCTSMLTPCRTMLDDETIEKSLMIKLDQQDLRSHLKFC